MKKEIVDREKVLKAFSQALLLKNKIQAQKSEMLDMYDDEGFLKPRYNSDYAQQMLDDMEANVSAYEEALAGYKGCFDVTVKDFADFVSEYIRKNYSVKSAVKAEKIPNSQYVVVKLELKAPIPELGLDKKEDINLAVIDEKYGNAKTNLLKSCFRTKMSDAKIPLLHYRSEDSVLLVNEEKNEYSTSNFLNITKQFMEERYLPDDYEAENAD